MAKPFRASWSRKLRRQQKKRNKRGEGGERRKHRHPIIQRVLSSDVTVAAEINGVTKNNPRTLKITTITNKQTNNYVHKYTGNMAQVNAFYLFSSYVKMKQSTADSIFAERWSFMDHHYFSRRKIMISFFMSRLNIQICTFHLLPFIFFVFLLLLTNKYISTTHCSVIYFFDGIFKVSPLDEFLCQLSLVAFVEKK